MRNKKVLEARDPNTKSNTERNLFQAPPLLDNLLKSNDTLRRLRSPLESTQQSSHNRPNTLTRTSRWQRCKPDTTVIKNATIKQSTQARINKQPSSSVPLANRFWYQLQSMEKTIDRKASSIAPTANRHLGPPNSPSYDELFRSPDQKQQLNNPRFHMSLLSQAHSLEPHGSQDGELPAIFMLNDDCLTEIFQWCASTTSLCRISSVCKHWRHIALQPHVWRTIDYTWSNFINQQAPIYKNTTLWGDPIFSKKRKLSDRSSIPTAGSNQRDTTPNSFSCLTHIRTIIIDDTGRHPSTVNLLRTVPSISPFTFVQTLRLSNMQFYNIVDLIDWYPNLQVLDCDRIQTLTSQVSVSLSVFNALGQLRVLKLHFGTICELYEGMPFNLGITTCKQQESQRSQLHTLAITNIYDIEERLTSGRSVLEANRQETDMAELIQCWDATEETLMRKYKVLTTFGNLTDLTLGSCTGFTARVWRECVAPCTKQLTRLSLCGWNGDGSRESPLIWQARYYNLTEESAPDMMEDVEMALAELLAGLSSLESLSLFNFKCSPGLIHGISKLNAPTVCYLDATNGNHSRVEIEPFTVDLGTLSNWILFKAEIKFVPH